MQSLLRTLSLALAVVGLAGCLGAPATLDPRAGTSAVEGPVGERPVWVHVWNSSIPVGLAYEIPAHYTETAGATGGLLGPGMLPIHLGEAPAWFVAEVNWAGAPGTQAQLMVSQAPEGGARIDFAAPGPQEFTGASPLCMAIPADALRAGTWQVMLHTLAGAQVEFALTVQVEGGAPEVGHGHEGWAGAADDAAGIAAGDVVEQPGHPCA